MQYFGRKEQEITDTTEGRIWNDTDENKLLSHAATTKKQYRKKAGLFINVQKAIILPLPTLWCSTSKKKDKTASHLIVNNYCQ